ncbi:MAG: S24/S26 family peptidase [Elusimicrobia bacterium]|nr:S24/S26 family peptidase [Elusimicrobiota bacterium]
MAQGPAAPSARGITARSGGVSNFPNDVGSIRPNLRRPEDLDGASQSATVSLYRLEGGCMRPLLRDGELLPIREARGENVRRGDMALYRIEGKRLLHRVWRSDAESLWLKDDAGTVELHRIPRRLVLGVPAFPRLFTQGRPGLVYSWLCAAAFRACRLLRCGFAWIQLFG